MHRCYPECRPDIGHHHHGGGEKSAEEQLRNRIKHLEKGIEKARQETNIAPNPSNFDIKDVKEYGPYKVLLVQYPNCTNYDGMKVIVAKCEMIDLVRLKRLDPHFTKIIPKDGVEIIARFPPSDSGVEMAKDFAKAMYENRLKPKPIPRTDW